MHPRSKDRKGNRKLLADTHRRRKGTDTPDDEQGGKQKLRNSRYAARLRMIREREAGDNDS